MSVGFESAKCLACVVSLGTVKTNRVEGSSRGFASHADTFRGWLARSLESGRLLRLGGEISIPDSNHLALY
jgi:hypothetical protein